MLTPVVADHVLLDDEALLAIVAFHDPRRAVPELGVDVPVPQIKRLKDVTVGVDNVVSAGHRRSSLGVSDAATC